ncbi:MAG: amidohydrolase family protein [bacterium]|nr:amidohydrolase family protein [bacterium]
MATTVLEASDSVDSEQEKLAIIDCDIHHIDAYQSPAEEVWVEYLPKEWMDYHLKITGRGRMGSSCPRSVPYAARHDAHPPSGPPGSDLAFMQKQLLDEWDMEYGILNPLSKAGGQQNLPYGAAIAQAVNEYQIAEWLERDSRLRASLVVPFEDGDLAAAEIDRLGDHPGFVQVMLFARTMEPLGRRKYWKIYEAAVQHNLPIGIHFGGTGCGPISGAGRVSYYIEDHGGMSTAFQAQVTSLVYEGVFEQFPDLKVVLIEGGFGWIPSLMWRLDACYQKLKIELPYLKRLPSEYIRDHFWISTQPVEEPSRPEYFHQMMDQMRMDDKLMFATDYPHWDFDSPDRALPSSLDRDVRKNIMAENARALYGLD